MISNKLLSEVLKYPMEVTTNVTYYISIISEPYFLDGNKTAVYFNTDNVGLGVCKINIYELANKCKEWAVKQGYTLESGLTWCNYYTNKDFTNDHTYLDYVVADTEPEAIFKACEWIMEQIK